MTGLSREQKIRLLITMSREKPVKRAHSRCIWTNMYLQFNEKLLFHPRLKCLYLPKKHLWTAMSAPFQGGVRGSGLLYKACWQKTHPDIEMQIQTHIPHLPLSRAPINQLLCVGQNLHFYLHYATVRSEYGFVASWLKTIISPLTEDDNTRMITLAQAM